MSFTFRSNVGLFGVCDERKFPRAGESARRSTFIVDLCCVPRHRFLLSSVAAPWEKCALCSDMAEVE